MAAYVPFIHVHVACDKATTPYAEFMWETMRSLAAHPDSMQLIIHSIGPTAGDRLTTKLVNAKSTSVHPYGPNTNLGLHGSYGHACCIMHSLEMTGDGNIHVICDSDAYVLARGWDNYVRRRIVLDGVGMMGTTYEDIGGFSSGAGASQTYKGKPTFTWVALNPRHNWQSLDVLPDKANTILVGDKAMKKTYGLPIGHSVFKEAGWQVPGFLAGNSISYDGWKQLKPSKDAVIMRGLTDYHEEFHADNVPFVAHHRGSLRHAYRGNAISQDFFKRMDDHLASEATHEVRWSWNPDTMPADAQAKVAAFEAMAATVAFNASPVPQPEPIVVGSTPALAEASPIAAHAETKGVSNSAQAIDGWMKGTLDGKGVWSRYDAPLPSNVAVTYVPDAATRNLRLEGTATCAGITLPSGESKAHTIVVRNMTAGPVGVTSHVGGAMCSVPSGVNWLLVVDADGVSHVC